MSRDTYICQAAGMDSFGNKALVMRQKWTLLLVLYYFDKYPWAISYSVIFILDSGMLVTKSGDGCKPVNNTFIPISGAEDFWQTQFRSISMFVRWPNFFQSFQRVDLEGWIFLPVQFLTPDWMELSPVYHKTHPSVKADPRHPQHHPHHHLPSHPLTQEVRPDSALHTQCHRQHRTVAKLETGKIFGQLMKSVWKWFKPDYNKKKPLGILSQSPLIVIRRRTFLKIKHNLTLLVTIRRPILIINLNSKGVVGWSHICIHICLVWQCILKSK